MAKRFTDNGLWEKDWFQDLPAAEKLAWFFIKDRCDAAGVWAPSKRAAEFFIGERIDWEGFAQRCNGNIELLPDGKWWLVDFVSFQNGVLRESCPPHRAVLALLEKHGLLERVLKGYRKGIDTLKEKEEEEDKEKEQDTGRTRAKQRTPYSEAFETFWSEYPRRDGSKSKAYEYWKRDKLDASLPAVLAKLTEYKRTPQWQRDAGQYIPYAQKWLNERRYEGEPEQVNKPSRPMASNL